MPTIYLGNHATIDKVPVDQGDGTHTYDIREVPGKNRMEFSTPDDWTRKEILTELGNTWPWHSAADRPAWVASTDTDLAAAAGALLGCEVRDLDLDHQPTTEG